MSVLKLSKNDITRNEDNENKIKLKKSDISYDSARVSSWETANKQALDVLNQYNTRINKSEWLTKEDRAAYRKALDSYIETSNYLRGINKTLGEGYTDEEETKWSESIASMNKGYDDISGFYDQFKDDREYNTWFERATKEKEYESIRSAEDFGEYSQIGSGVANPSWNDAHAPFEIFGWKPFGDGETINNMVTFAEAYGGEAFTAEAQALRGGGRDEYAETIGLINNHMRDEEKSIYNYYIGKGDTDKANEYLTYIIDVLKQRQAGKFVEQADNNALEMVFSAAAGIENAITGFRNLGNMITGDEGVPTSSLQYAQSTMSGNNEGAWKVTNDLINTTGNMLPSILVGSVTGGLGGALTLGASASGNAYAEMRHLGYDRGQATAYAGLVGASEAALSYALGGISKLGGGSKGIFQTIAGKIVPKLDNAIARIAIDLGGNMLDEGLEEAIQEVLDPVFKMLATGEDFEGIDLENVLYSGLLGALSAGVLEGVPTIAGQAVRNSNATAFDITGVQDLVTESLEINPDNAHAQRMQTRLDQGKYVSQYQVDRMVAENEATMLEQDRGKIKAVAETQLAKYGETGDIGKIAEVIAKTRSGEKLSKAEQDILVNSKYGRRVSTELNPEIIASGEYTTDWTADIGTERINYEAYNRNTPTQDGINVPEAKKPVGVVDAPEKEIVTAGKIEPPVDAKTTIERDGKEVEVNIEKIASIDNGEISLKLDNGEVVDASEVNYGGQMALIYQAASDMATRVGGFNVDTANVFVNGFDPTMGLTAAEYVHGFSDAYRFGKLGYPVSELESGVYTSKLTDEQRTRAYTFGKVFGNDKVAEKQTKVSKNGETMKKGKVIFDGKVAGKNLTERERASLKGLRVVAEALGVDIHIFESPLVNGERVGENGSYDPVTKTLRIDRYAGVKGDGLMLYTGSHELTHHIKEVSPAKFKIFADALLEEYTKHGQSVEELIQRKLEILEANGRLKGKTAEQAYDLAYEEVVADSCEAMLVDSKAIEALSRKIKSKDKGLWQTIKDFIAKLVARIKAAYKGLSPDSYEANYVRGMVDAAERLQKLWVDALLDASENNISLDNTLMENGIVVDSKTESASLMSVRDVLTDAERKKVSKALAERFGVTQAEAMDWLKAETSLASLILNPKYSQYLDYTADASEEAIKSNSDYPQGTVDFSNICKKRRDFTEVMNRVLRNFPNHVFEATDLAKIRTIMEEEGMEVACAICYVEDRRQLDGPVAQDFIDSLSIYREGGKIRPDGKPFNANQLKAFKLIEGDSYTPSIYELISLKGRNALKAKNPAMEEAWVKFNNARGMQSVRLLLNDAEYKRQILKYSPTVVKRKNDLGGLRIYSFSDAEMFHLIDIIQVITDSATVGLSLQGYTKVNEYAKAVKDTGEKLNRSLIPKGDLGYHMEDGRVVLDFDTVEGIDINHPDFFDNIDNPNIGNIVIGINATQIKAAMTSKFIDQIIPFHTGQSNEVLGVKGIAAWANYKDFQSERDASTKKKSSHQINIYTEVINAAEAEGHPITNKVEFVNKFLAVCKENNLIPRFSDFLNVDENGDYVYTEGYHKFLVDFKTFDQNTGEYLPQMPVKPIFDNEYITKLLTDYVESQKVKDAEFTKAMPKVLDRITEEIVKSDGVKYSDRFSEKPLEEYSNQEYNSFGWARVADAISFNELNDLYSKINGRTSLSVFNQSSRGEAIIEVNNKPNSTLDVDNVFVFVVGTKNNFAITRVVRFQAKTATEMEILKEDLYDGRSWSDSYFSFLSQEGLTKEYRRENSQPFEQYQQEVRRRSSGQASRRADSNNRKSKYRSGYTLLVGEDGEITESNYPQNIEYRYSDRDSVGNTLTKEQQEFFRESVVRDNKGNLMVLYHGTTAAFNTFKKGDIGFHFGTKGAARGRVGFGKNVTLKEVYLNITNPIVFDEDLGSWDADYRLTRELYERGILTQEEAESVLFTDDRQYRRTTEAANKKLASVLLEKGYDGIAYSNTFETKKPTTSYIVFNSNQAKEITNKTPTPNPDIRYSDRDQVKVYHGSKNSFDKFDFSRLKDELGVFFSEDESGASSYGNVSAYTLSPKKTLVVHQGEEYRKIMLTGETDAEKRARFTKEGYDTIKLVYNKPGGGETVEWVALTPDVINKTPRYSDRNTASFNGKAFWSGSVSLLDGVIEEVHTMEEAEAVDYHHSMYFSSAQVEKMESGENAFFWVDNGKVQGNWRESVPQNILKRIEEQIEISPSVAEAREFSDAEIKYSIREEAPPKKTKEGYKVFVVKNGKLYPPMVANPNAEDTPVGVWLNADVGTRAPDSKTGRMQVKAGGKGTQGGSGSLAFRPGWHLGETPLATQFDRLNPETGVKELFPENFVWALCDIAADHDYQEEAMSYGYTKNGKFQHSLAGLPKLPADGYYKYRTNPNPDTVPWLITGAMKVKRLLSDAEVNAILEEQGLAPKQRVGGNKTLADLGLSEYEGKVFSDRDPDGLSNRSLLTSALETATLNEIERRRLAEYKEKIDLINAEEQNLRELREKIKELSFAKGPRDTKAIRELQFEANQAANRINTYDRQLLQLESTKALRGVLEREKEQAYKRAERRGKEALERYREKAAETQRALITRYQETRKKGIESRNKTAMRHKIKDVVNELNQYLLKGTKEKHIPIELQKPVAEALDAVNMDTVGAEERIARLQAEMMRAKTPEAIQEIAKKIEHIQEMGGNMEAKLSRLKTAYDSIINSDDPLVANSHDEVISNTIANVMEFVGSTPLRDMSLGQLEAVYDMYRMVLHSIRTANKAFKAKKSEEISVIANRVLEEIDKLGKKHIYRTDIGDAISTFDWDNLKPVYAFERIGSDTFNEVFTSVRAAEDVWAVDMTEAQTFREEQHKKYKYDSWDFTKRYEFTSTSGKSFKLSLDQIMSLYAYSKRGDQAKDHLKNGGFVFDGLTEVKQKGKLGVTKTYKLKDATAYNLSDEILASIIGKLTPEQKTFVDVMQDYLSTVMGEKGNEVSLELYGVKLFKEKNYFPLRSAPQYLERAREQAQQTAKIKNSGFTKETTPKARNPIVLTSFMDVWAGHVNEMSMYHAFTLPLEDFYRVYNYKTPASETMAQESVIQFLENAHGDASVSYIDQLLKDLNGGARSDPRETVAKALMSRFKKTAVMASLSVVVQQPTALIRAMALVDAKYFGVAPITKGVLRAFNPKKHKALWEEVKKYAPVAIIKEMGYFDTGMGKSSVEWLKGEKTFMDKVDDALTKAPAVADELAWISIWEAVKRETAHKNPTLKTNSEEFLKLVGERFTEVIVKTQVYDSTLAKSSNMRSKSAFMNMWTAFMAEPTTTINMVMDAFRKGDKKFIAKVLGATAGSIALNAALVSLVYAMRDDDEDETFTEKYLSRVTTELVDGINPITYIPGFKDVWSIMQGFDVERADMSLINDLISTAQKAITTISKDTSEMDEEELKAHQNDVSEALWGIVDSVSSLVGIPVKNIRRDTNGIINLFKTLGRDADTSWGSLMDNIAEDLHSTTPIWNWFKGDSKVDKLYDAIISGDKEYVDRLKSGYKDDSSYNAALRKALRENDPRIKEAAEAVINGKGSEYSRIINEIVNEGKFDRKIVSGAIAAEVEKMRKAD